jgi:hypothetical protein
LINSICGIYLFFKANNKRKKNYKLIIIILGSLINFGVLLNFICLFVYHSYFIFKGITTYEYILRKEKKENIELSSNRDSIDSVDEINKNLMRNKKMKNSIKYNNRNKNKEEKEENKKKIDILEKSDEINFLNQKKEILSYNNMPRLNDKKEISFNNINEFENNKINDINNNKIKINNYIQERKNSPTIGNEDSIHKKTFNNIILNNNKENGYELFDKFKLMYNKNRNKVSSKDLIQKLDMLSKKDDESGNKGINLYKIQGEKIIIDNENPKENIFNHLVEEIYTNKSSTKAIEIKKGK